jgi:hypothetical protein
MVPVYVYSALAPIAGLNGLRRLSLMAIRQNGCRHLTQRRSPLGMTRRSLRISDVEGASQQGLSIMGTRLISVLFTYLIFLLMFKCSHFSASSTSRRSNLRPGPALLVDVIQAERFAEVPTLRPETSHVFRECGLTDALTERGDGAA